MKEIYTDGACLGNPGPGGYASVLLNDSEQKYEVLTQAGIKTRTTNNVMEIMAVLSAMKAC